MSQDLERSGYVLVVGNEGRDRTWVEETLLRGGLTVASASEAETLAVHDLMPPRLVVLDDASPAAERVATQRRLRGHPSLQGVPVLVLAYDTDVDALIPRLIEAVASVPRVIAEPGPGVQLSGFGADGLDLLVLFWIADPHNGQGNVKSDVNLMILRTLTDAGVQIPYPQRVVHQA